MAVPPTTFFYTVLRDARAALATRSDIERQAKERGDPVAALCTGWIQREVVIIPFDFISPFTGPKAGGGAR